jgi:hypothetical protein
MAGTCKFWSVEMSRVKTMVFQSSKDSKDNKDSNDANDA